MGLPILQGGPSAGSSNSEASFFEFTFLSLVMTFTLMWCLVIAGWKAYTRYSEGKEKLQSDYLILDDNDHYQRLY